MARLPDTRPEEKAAWESHRQPRAHGWQGLCNGLLSTRGTRMAGSVQWAPLSLGHADGWVSAMGSPEAILVYKINSFLLKNIIYSFLH